MRYEDESAGAGVSGAASRWDRWGARRGNPYAADPAWDEPPARRGTSPAAWTGGSVGAAGGDDGYGGWDAGGGYGAYGAGDGGWDDSADLYAADVAVYPGPWLPPYVWARWRRRPWFPRLQGMLRRARPAGALRHPRTGARYPVFRGRMGGRSWRVVTRPRGMRFEVMGMEAETGPEDEPLAMDGGADSIDDGWAPSAPAVTDDDGDCGGDGNGGGGYRLRLPHAGLHAILGRLRPEQLRGLAGGSLPADPAAAVARGVGRVARRARRMGRFPSRGGPRLDVFGTRGYRLLVRPTGEMEGEILAVTPVRGELEEESRKHRSIQGTMTWYGPYRFVPRGPDVLTTIPGGPPLLHVGGKGVYLVEKRGSAGFAPVYVGKADTSFHGRLGERRTHLRQMKVDLARYRVFLGVPSAATTPADLFALEHAVVRSVVRGFTGAGAGATDKKTAEAIPTSQLSNVSPRVPFKVIGPGLKLVHRQAPGHTRPAYLRSGSGAADQWYELPE
jgi:hypothetical protein